MRRNIPVKTVSGAFRTVSPVPYRTDTIFRCSHVYTLIDDWRRSWLYVYLSEANRPRARGSKAPWKARSAVYRGIVKSAVFVLRSIAMSVYTIWNKCEYQQILTKKAAGGGGGGVEYCRG